MEVPAPVARSTDRDPARVLPSKPCLPSCLPLVLSPYHLSTFTWLSFTHTHDPLTHLSLHLHPPLPFHILHASLFCLPFRSLLPTLSLHLLPSPCTLQPLFQDNRADGRLFGLDVPLEISSAVESATLAKNRHCPTLAECRGKGRGLWRGPALPSSCTKTLPVCTPRRAVGKQVCL